MTVAAAPGGVTVSGWDDAGKADMKDSTASIVKAALAGDETMSDAERDLVPAVCRARASSGAHCEVLFSVQERDAAWNESGVDGNNRRSIAT